MKLPALSLLALALAIPAAASGKPVHAAAPCSARACHAHIKLSGRARWSSPQRLSGELQTLTLRVGKKELSYEPAGGCVAYFYGRGVVARLSVCGRGRVPIKIRAVRLDPRPVTLRLSYRVLR